MRGSPALNSAVLALFAVVPGARYSAGEISGHVPALNRSPYCMVFFGIFWVVFVLHISKTLPTSFFGGAIDCKCFSCWPPFFSSCCSKRSFIQLYPVLTLAQPPPLYRNSVAETSKATATASPAAPSSPPPPPPLLLLLLLLLLLVSSACVSRNKQSAVGCVVGDRTPLRASVCSCQMAADSTAAAVPTFLAGPSPPPPVPPPLLLLLLLSLPPARVPKLYCIRCCAEGCRAWILTRFRVFRSLSFYVYLHGLHRQTSLWNLYRIVFFGFFVLFYVLVCGKFPANTTKWMRNVSSL